MDRFNFINKQESRAPDASFYIAKYIIPILERKKMVISFFILGLITAIPIMFIVKPEYVTTAAVFVEEPYYQTQKIWENSPAPKLPSGGYVEMEVERIKSLSFILQVVKILPDQIKAELNTPYTIKDQIVAFIKTKLEYIFGKKTVEKLFGKPKPILSKEEQEMRLAFQVQSRITISSRPKDGLIFLEARTLKRDVGPAILRAYLEVWLAQNLEENKESAKSKTRIAKKLRDEAYNRLVEAQNELSNFKRKYEIPGGLEVTRDVNIMVKLKRLESNVEMAKEKLKAMDDLYVSARMAEAGIVSNIKIIDYPEMPTEVVRRKSIKIMIAQIGLFSAVGIVLAFIMEFFESPVRTEEDIEDVVDIPIRGQIGKVE